jgi:hypothetical protein
MVLESCNGEMELNMKENGF